MLSRRGQRGLRARVVTPFGGVQKAHSLVGSSGLPTGVGAEPLRVEQQVALVEQGRLGMVE